MPICDATLMICAMAAQAALPETGDGLRTGERLRQGLVAFQGPGLGLAVGAVEDMIGAEQQRPAPGVEPTLQATADEAADRHLDLAVGVHRVGHHLLTDLDHVVAG
jgi:hypothetical protein